MSVYRELEINNSPLSCVLSRSNTFYKTCDFPCTDCSKNNSPSNRIPNGVTWDASVATATAEDNAKPSDSIMGHKWWLGMVTMGVAGVSVGMALWRITRK